MTRPNVKALLADIDSADVGGFTAIASSPTVDRDGEILASRCFVPLPSSIPVHLDHTLNAAGVIGRAAPYYVGSELHIDATLASTADAQLVRTKLAEGVLVHVSVVFRGLEWQQIDGARTCVRGELLACDVVSIPSNREARVLTVRGYDLRPKVPGRVAYDLAQARKAMVAYDLAEARRILATYPDRPATGSLRRRVDDMLKNL